MFKANASEKGVILLIVLGTVLIVTILAAVILGLTTSQSRLTLYQVSRTKAYYAVKGMMNYSLEMLRKGTWTADAAVNKYACFGNCAALGVPSPDYTIPADTDMPPWNILVTIHPLDQALSNTVTQIDIKTDYTYNP